MDTRLSRPPLALPDDTTRGRDERHARLVSDSAYDIGRTGRGERGERRARLDCARLDYPSRHWSPLDDKTRDGHDARLDQRRWEMRRDERLARLGW